MSDQKPLSTDPREGLAPVTPTAEGPKMSASVHPAGIPGLALPEGSLDALEQRKLVSDATAATMTTPLARPTGIDAVDSMLSPSSLAMMAFSGGPTAVKAVSSAVADLTEAAGGALTRKVLKFVTPALLKKPGELADILNEIGKAVKAKQAPAGAPGEAPVAATVQPPAAMPMASPAPASPAAAASEPVAATPAPTAPPMKMSDRLNLFMRTARQAGVTLSPDDYLALNKAVTAGADPQAVIGALVAERNPAAAFASKYNLPQPTGNDLRFPKGMRGKATGAQQ